MRSLSLALLTAALLSACSHETKKADTQPEAKAPPPQVAAEATKVDSGKSADTTKVECSRKADARVLEVRAKNKGCELAYTKAGKEGIVASSSKGMNYCTKALEKLRDKLKGSGYDCK